MIFTLNLKHVFEIQLLLQSFVFLFSLDYIYKLENHFKVIVEQRWPSGKACGARGPGFDSRHRHLNFQRLVISCFQVEIWLKDHLIDVNPQNNQPTKSSSQAAVFEFVFYSLHTVTACACLTSITWIYYDAIWPIGSLSDEVPPDTLRRPLSNEMTLL